MQSTTPVSPGSTDFSRKSKDIKREPMPEVLVISSIGFEHLLGITSGEEGVFLAHENGGWGSKASISPIEKDGDFKIHRFTDMGNGKMQCMISKGHLKPGELFKIFATGIKTKKRAQEIFAQREKAGVTAGKFRGDPDEDGVCDTGGWDRQAGCWWTAPMLYSMERDEKGHTTEYAIKCELEIPPDNPGNENLRYRVETKTPIKSKVATEKKSKI